MDAVTQRVRLTFTLESLLQEACEVLATHGTLLPTLEEVGVEEVS